VKSGWHGRAELEIDEPILKGTGRPGNTGTRAARAIWIQLG
jgi:hypothetical protein